ncbi:MAG: molybdopterin-dependent oxidoreductase [Deltaproteobacteria bacterium]|nr:molybdopterin-dependent oxidoreductase [Deltaproteobacteria bacterium]
MRTLCRSCSAACGIVVDVERNGQDELERSSPHGASGGRVVAVRGDPENPRSRGYLCPKGASLAEFHHRATRLEHPRLRGTRASWREALDDLGATLARLRRESGADAIALYQGTGAVSDSLGLQAIQGLIAGLGTRQFYTAATVDVAPALRAGEMVAGFFHPWPVWVPEDPQSRLAILIGWNPAVTHGYLTLLPNPVERIRAFRRRGGEVVVVDPRETRTARLADRHLAPRPGTDAILLAWLVREALESANAVSGGFHALTHAADREVLHRVLAPLTLERVARETGLAADDLEALVAAIRSAGRINVVAATGITLGADALLCEWLRWALLLATDSLDHAGGMWFNPGVLTRYEETGLPFPPAPPEGRVEPGPRSRPELVRILDQQPCVALVDEIEAGHVRALFVAGSSPLSAFPEPERMKRALARLDALVVLDIAETPLAELATHVLPTTGQLERADLVIETQAIYAPAAVAPIAERRPMWRILAELGQCLDVDVLGGGLDPAATTDEALVRRAASSARGGADALLAAGSRGIDPPRAYGWVRRHALPDGRFRLTPPGFLERLHARLATPKAEAPFTLVSARQLTRTNSTPYMDPARSPDAPTLRIHPEDAAGLGIAAGSRVELKSEAGALVAEIDLDPLLSRGVVALAPGWLDTNASRLTSTRRSIDPLTGQPPMTAFEVWLTAID